MNICLFGPHIEHKSGKNKFSPLFPTQIECASDELFAVDLFVGYSYIFLKKETELNLIIFIYSTKYQPIIDRCATFR